MQNLQDLAALLRRLNVVADEIVRLIGRPASTGHMGEYIASQLFDLELSPSANQAGIDGHFRSGGLAGRSVNVKWYTKLETLDMHPAHVPDFYLVLSGPRSKALNSRHMARPHVITQVFIFESVQLLAELATRNIRPKVGTSVRRSEWEAAEIFPRANCLLYQLSAAQRENLILFG